MLLAGLGSAPVISPNQTITLSQVPPEGGGSAAGVLRTGQRIGTAIGIAAVGAAFFTAVHGGAWATAFRHGLIVVTAFVLAALGIAPVDLLAGRRAGRPARRVSRDTPG